MRPGRGYDKSWAEATESGGWPEERGVQDSQGEPSPEPEPFTRRRSSGLLRTPRAFSTSGLQNNKQPEPEPEPELRGNGDSDDEALRPPQSPAAGSPSADSSPGPSPLTVRDSPDGETEPLRPNRRQRGVSFGGTSVSTPAQRLSPASVGSSLLASPPEDGLDNRSALHPPRCSPLLFCTKADSFCSSADPLLG